MEETEAKLQWNYDAKQQTDKHKVAGSGPHELLLKKCDN